MSLFNRQYDPQNITFAPGETIGLSGYLEEQFTIQKNHPIYSVFDELRSSITGKIVKIWEPTDRVYPSDVKRDNDAALRGVGIYRN